MRLSARNRKSNMSLEIRWGRRPRWSGRIIRAGKRHRLDLAVPVEGKPPASGRLNDKGDDAFERSRIKAELELERKIKEFELENSGWRPPQTNQVTPIQNQCPGIELTKMFDRFESLPRSRRISDSSLAQAKSFFTRFTAFVRKRRPLATHMADVDVEIAEAFMASEGDRGLAPKTYNDSLNFLRRFFARLKGRTGLQQNPFADIPLQEPCEIGRVPFSIEELEAILAEVKKPEYEFIRPIIIVGICTAMRRGDCCRLRWADVDLAGGFIEVVTSKKRTNATIPLFRLLREEIARKLPRKGEFVFPEQELMYRVNPDGISYRVQKVLKGVGFFDAAEEAPEGYRGRVTAKREFGLRAASIRGFHSFRVTWSTVALIAGVKPELVAMVTGHKTMSVLFNSYFKPNRDALRRALEEKMPRMFSIGCGSALPVELPSRSVCDRLRAMTAENWSAMRDELLHELEPTPSNQSGRILTLK